MNRFIILLFTYLLGVSSLFCQMSSWEVVQDMGRGLNLGNALSAPVEGNWAPVVYEQYFIDVADAGFSNVRIPIDFYGSRTSGNTASWSSLSNTSNQYQGNETDFSVSASYMDRVQTLVDWSLNQGLFTIIDIHGAELKSEFLETFNIDNTNYSAPSSAKRAADLMKFKSIWIQIANRFVSHPSNLLFEVVNEPYFEVSASEMDAINLMIIEAIRATGGNNSTRPIIITGGGSNSYQAPTTISTEVLQSDSNLIASFHYYQPFSFTSSSKEQFNDFNWGTNADKSNVASHFDVVRSWSETNNIPVTLGEFAADNEGGLNYQTGVYGSYGGPVHADRVEYHRYLAEQAINRGFSFSAWCSGNKSNKTIHLRTDNPNTINAYPGIWVEDVKQALLADGDWPDCYGPSDAEIVRNPDFECGFSNHWDLFLPGNNNTAQATFSESTTTVFSGSTAARIDVTSAQDYNKVLLRNAVYQEDLSNQTLTIGCYAKALGNNVSFRMRIKSQLSENTIFIPSEIFQLTSSYQYYEFEYPVPEGSSNLQLQVLVGAYVGTYFLDAFYADAQSSSLGISQTYQDLEMILFPNPTVDYLYIKSNQEIESVRVYNVLGGLVISLDKPQKIDIQSLARGLYLLEAKFNNGAQLNQKFIKD